MTIFEALEKQEREQEIFDSLSIDRQIEILTPLCNSVFIAYYKDGKTKVRGDELNQKEMRKFFKKHPQNGVEKIKFIK